MGAPTPILTAVYRGRTEEPAALLAQRPALTLFEAAAIGDVEAIGAALRAAAEAAVDALLAARADVRALSDNDERNIYEYTA